jgi:hypothetical protein
LAPASFFCQIAHRQLYERYNGKKRRHIRKENKRYEIGIIGESGRSRPSIITAHHQALSGKWPRRLSSIVMESINMTAMLKLVSEKDWDGLTSCWPKPSALCIKAGAGLQGLRRIHAHRFRTGPARVALSSRQHCGSGTKRIGQTRLKKVGLLGTLFTMQRAIKRLY